jgi:glycosyltransferase involved in cell wall biosynthesis
LGSIRVLFDTQAFRHQRYGGISRYYAELIRRLPSLNVDPVLHLPWVNNEYAVAAGLSSHRGATMLSAHPVFRWFYYLALRGNDLLQGVIDQYDILHRTYYAAPYPVRHPTVCTVVDMIPELLPHYFPEGNPHRRKREVVHASDMVLSISESTTRDLVEFYGYPASRVVTTPLGIDCRAFADVPKVSHPFRPPYLLFVGLRHRYKNFRRFGLAAAAVLAAHPEVSLALVGGGALLESEREIFVRAGVFDRVVQANVADEALPTIYREAEVFVFPSEYEGFGLPILESFACACPVAASRASSFPEVGGPAIEYFDPQSTDDIAQSIERILNSRSHADELRRLGSERVKAYSWQRTAELTAEAYRRLG